MVEEIYIAKSHKDTWDYCLKQLELQISRETFLKWVVPLYPLSRDGATLELSTPDQLICDWAADRLTSTIMRLVEGINPAITQVVFSVSSKPTAPAPLLEIEPVRVNEGPDSLAVTNTYQSLWEVLVRPDRVAAINSYSLRHIPYVGASAWLSYIGFSQEKYLKSTGNHFATTIREIARWTGLSTKTIDRLLEADKLGWFVKKTGTSAINDNGQVRRLTCFEMPALLPLTPGDAFDLRKYLKDAGIQDNPACVLEEALSIQPSQILHFPTRLPDPTDQISVGQFQTVQTVVEDLVGGLSADISNLCSRLHQHLTGSHFLMVPWYFLKKGLPNLSADMGACALLANSFTYHNPESGENRNDFWMSMDALAGRLGTTPEQVRSWFPKVMHTHPGQSDKTNQLSRYITRPEYKKVEGGCSWHFVVSPLASLTPKDETALDAAVLLIESVDHQVLFNWVESVFVQIAHEDQNRFLSKSLEEESVFVQIKAMLESVFVQIDPGPESVFVQILKILKESRYTFLKKNTSSNQRNKNVMQSKPEKLEEEAFSWEIQKLATQVHDLEIREKIIKTVPAGVFASQIIAAVANPRVQDPTAVAIYNVLQDSRGWAEGAAYDLAAIPSKIASEIRDHLQLGWCSSDSLYGRVFADVPMVRIKMLTRLLGIAVQA